MERLSTAHPTTLLAKLANLPSYCSGGDINLLASDGSKQSRYYQYWAVHMLGCGCAEMSSSFLPLDYWENQKAGSRSESLLS